MHAHIEIAIGLCVVDLASAKDRVGVFEQDDTRVGMLEDLAIFEESFGGEGAVESTAFARVKLTASEGWGSLLFDHHRGFFIAEDLTIFKQALPFVKDEDSGIETIADNTMADQRLSLLFDRDPRVGVLEDLAMLDQTLSTFVNEEACTLPFEDLATLEERGAFLFDLNPSVDISVYPT